MTWTRAPGWRISRTTDNRDPRVGNFVWRRGAVQKGIVMTSGYSREGELALLAIEIVEQLIDNGCQARCLPTEGGGYSILVDGDGVRGDVQIRPDFTVQVRGDYGLRSMVTA